MTPRVETTLSADDYARLLMERDHYIARRMEGEPIPEIRALLSMASLQQRVNDVAEHIMATIGQNHAILRDHLQEYMHQDPLTNTQTRIELLSEQIRLLQSAFEELQDDERLAKDDLTLKQESVRKLLANCEEIKALLKKINGFDPTYRHREIKGFGEITSGAAKWGARQARK